MLHSLSIVQVEEDGRPLHAKAPHGGLELWKLEGSKSKTIGTMTIIEGKRLFEVYTSENSHGYPKQPYLVYTTF